MISKISTFEKPCNVPSRFGGPHHRFKPSAFSRVLPLTPSPAQVIFLAPAISQKIAETLLLYVCDLYQPVISALRLLILSLTIRRDMSIVMLTLIVQRNG
jgi:hypothetical protein